MNKEELENFAREAAKGIKTEQDLSEFSQMLKKVVIETALNTELDEHLGYSKYDKQHSDNCRNGYSGKTLRTEDGEFELNTPRDRQGEFEPQLVKKRQTRFTSMDDKILSLYAKGLTTREIAATFKEMYGAEVSATLISRVTDAIIERVVEWQSRPLDTRVYAIVYLDCIMLKIRQDKQVIKKAVYLVLGVNMDGHKELLGLWLSENESAKFWLKTAKTKNCGSRTTTLTMAFKLMEVAQKKWFRLRGSKLLADVIEGIKFVNGVKQNGDQKQEAA